MKTKQKILIWDTVNLDESFEGCTIGVVIDIMGNQYHVRVANGSIVCKDPGTITLF